MNWSSLTDALRRHFNSSIGFLSKTMFAVKTVWSSHFEVHTLNWNLFETLVELTVNYSNLLQIEISNAVLIERIANLMSSSGGFFGFCFFSDFWVCGWLPNAFSSCAFRLFKELELQIWTSSNQFELFCCFAPFAKCFRMPLVKANIWILFYHFGDSKPKRIRMPAATRTQV